MNHPKGGRPRHQNVHGQTNSSKDSTGREACKDSGGADCDEAVYRPLGRTEMHGSTKGAVAPNITALVHDLVDPTMDATHNYKSKVKAKHLLVDNPGASHAVHQARRDKRAAAKYKRKNRPLNSTQRKALLNPEVLIADEVNVNLGSSNGGSDGSSGVVGSAGKGGKLTYESVSSLKKLWSDYIDDAIGLDFSPKPVAEKKDKRDTPSGSKNGKEGKGADDTGDANRGDSSASAKDGNVNVKEDDTTTIGGLNKAIILSRLIKCDLHGSELKVVRSKNPTFVGLQGILLRETENMMEIISKDDKIKHVPKKNNVFGLDLHGNQILIYGSHLKIRSAERSSKKFKGKPTIDL